MLTPLEIQNKVFKKSTFGYAKDDVEEFFRLVYEEYDKLYTENIALRDKIGILADAVKQYKSMEDTLQNTLLVAQSTGEEVKKAAYEKSETITREAELKAAKIIDAAKREADEIVRQRDALSRELDLYKAKVTSLLQSQLNLLNGMTEANGPAEEEKSGETVENIVGHLPVE